MTEQISKQIEYMFEDSYYIKHPKHKQYNFIIRPEEKAGLKSRLVKDEKFRNAYLGKVANDELFATIEYSTRFKSNSIVQIWGIPESGKSTVGKRIVYEIDTGLRREGFRPEINTTFNYVDTLHDISKFGMQHLDQEDKFTPSKRRLIEFQDEQSKLQGSESRAYETQLDTLLERFRAAQVFVVLVAPNLRDFSVCNTYIECIAKDVENRVNLAMWYVLQRNHDGKDKLVPKGHLLLEYKPEVEEYFEQYDQEKMNDIVQLMKNRGFQGVQIPQDILDQGIEIVLEQAEKRGLRTKEQVKRLTMTLGLGTTNISKVIAELAALEFEIDQEEQAEEQKRKEEELEEQRLEEKRLETQKLVEQISEKVSEDFDFIGDSGPFSRLVEGYLIEQYPEDWQELIKHKSQILALAQFKQWRVKDKLKHSKNIEELLTETSDIQTLRRAFQRAVYIRYENDLLALRTSYYFVFDEDEDLNSWSKQKASSAMRREIGNDISYGAYRKYLNDWSDEVSEIKKNRKLWGDVGELYFSYRVMQIVEKGKSEGWIKPKLAIDSPPAAERRSAGNKHNQSDNNDSKLSIHDIEIVINQKSMAAINAKFTIKSNQGYTMSPECEHDNPYLFIIDKDTQQEFLLPAERGKLHFNVNWGNKSQFLSIEDFIRSLVEKYNSQEHVSN